MKNEQNSRFAELGKAIETGDGSVSLIHPEHGECYHSESGALMEAENLYIASSGISLEWNKASDDSVCILDVGLGLAYNALSTFKSWLASEGLRNVELVSLEINNDLVVALASGEAPWQGKWDDQALKFAKSLNYENHRWKGEVLHPVSQKKFSWEVYIGDALNFDSFGDGFQYIWQDPFSPKKNPTMWSKEWFEKVLSSSKPHAMLMTYSVSRVVKDALTDAGWKWERFEAMGNKRNWLRAVNPKD